jgi:hypothetical protein
MGQPLMSRFGMNLTMVCLGALGCAAVAAAGLDPIWLLPPGAVAVLGAIGIIDSWTNDD